MDGFARGLVSAYNLLKDKTLEIFIEKRYDSWNSGIGKTIRDGKAGLTDLDAYVLDTKAIKSASGR